MTTEIEALVARLQRPYGNLTGGEKQDIATALTALQADLAAAVAALDRIKADAGLAGWKRARDEAADVKAFMPGSGKQKPILTPWRDAILALTPPADLAARIGGAE